MTAPSTTSWLRGIGSVAAVAVPLAALAWLNALAPETLQPAWDAARALSYPVGIAAAILVTFRLVMMGADVRRWSDPRGRHLMFWFAWIASVQFIAGLGAGYYDASGTPATWLSGARLVSHLIAILLCVRWPHPDQYVPLEERS